MLSALILASLAFGPPDLPLPRGPENLKPVSCPSCPAAKAALPPSCPSCPAAKATVSTDCPDTCKCPFPGACGRTGCHCGFALGWVPPPKDEWRVFTANPAWEVYGHEWNGVFRYTASRLRKTVPQVPAMVPAAR